MDAKAKLLATVAVASLITSAPAFAQTTAAEPPAGATTSDLSEVVVTGSSLRGVAPVGSALMAVGRDEIAASGVTTTAQLLLDMPQVLNLGVSEASRASNGGSANFTYTQGLNIHGIGPYATLVLVDGRRTVPQGVLGQFTDISVIPTIALQRIELVPDGASAIYGSDAIAGVANFILRRSVEGVEATATYGFADDYDERQFGVIAGKGWGSGRMTLAYSYSGHSALNTSDRSYSRADLRGRGGSDFRSTQCNPGNILIAGTSYAIPTGGVTPANAGQLLPGTSNRCELFTDADLLPKINRHSAVATFDQDVTDTLSIRGTAIAMRREVSIRTGLSTASLSVPAANAFYTRPAPGVSPETVAYAFTELPANDSDSVAKFYQGTVGATLKLPREWQAKLDFTYGVSKDDFSRTHAINAPALAAALASGNPATAFNPYGGANSAGVLAGIGNGVSSFAGESRQHVTDLALDGPLFELPGGTVRMALGYQHQYTSLEQFNITGNTAAVVRTKAVDASRDVDSAYAEILLPLVGPQNALPGIRSLSIDLAGRYDRYEGVGSTKNPKIGVNWEPIEGLTLHASYGKSFRAPPIFQVRGAATMNVITLPDPLLGGANTTALQITGGNVGITPETARTYSFGFDYQPSFAPNFRLQVSYFDVDYENILASLGNNAQILNQSLYANLGIIQRNPTPAQVAQALAQYPLLAGVVPATVPVILDLRTRNLGALTARGVDVVATHRVQTDRAGDFTFGVSATYFLEYKTSPAPGAPFIDVRDTILNPLTFQGRGYVAWQRDDWSARAAVNLTDSYRNNLVTPAQKVKDYATVDFRVAYDLANILPKTPAERLTLALDVTNLFDSKPPFVNIAPSTSGGGGFDATVASPVGRLVSVSLSAAF